MKNEFDIPENCEKVIINQVDNKVIVEFVPKEELKELDCYKAIFDCFDAPSYFIFKSKKITNNKKCNNYYVGVFTENYPIELDNEHSTGCIITKISREEMQAKLSEHGKYFDFDEKKLKDLKWRAKKGEIYYTISFFDGKISAFREESMKIDDNNYNLNNYFKTPEEAEKFREYILNYKK